MAEPQVNGVKSPVYVHLRTHSAYSLSEGAIGVKELVKLCQKHQMPAVGLTDTNNLFGSLEFSLAAAGEGIQPIIGAQLDFKPQVEAGEKNFRSMSHQAEPEQLVLLVKSEVGYYHLLELSSRAFLHPAEGTTAPMLDYADLQGKSDGLIALTGGIKGGVGRLLQTGRKDDAEKLLLQLAGLFPHNLYVELQRHNLPEEKKIEGELIALAMKHNLPLVATNEPFFGAKEKYEAHDALLCIAGGTYITEENRRRLTPQHYFKSQAEMATLFADVPEALANTLKIAQRCAFMSPKREPILPSFVSEEDKAKGIDEAVALREQSREGLEYRLKNFVFTEDMDEAAREEVGKPYRDRLEFELDVIIQMQFPGYFLIVSDFIKWSKQNGIPVGPGRGSGAGSVVAWSLLITDLDPLRYGLLFERFLNPERVSMPDFDIDFCQSKRDRVIDYVQKKYGYERVAQIITFGKLQARAVLRDVGRVLQMPYGQIDRISKLVPNNPANPVTLQQAIDLEPQLRAMQEEDDSVAKLITIALQLEGLYRHASTHAAGVVIADRSLDELVPMYRDPKSDMPVVQYSMKYAETAGLVKFDFLGLKTLSVLQQSVEFAKATCDVDIDLLKLPEGDKPTYAMLSKGDAVGVFQFESAGMRDALRKLKPDCLEDLIALGALYRPGPMDNIPTYIACKHGKEEPDYLHPMLEEVLKETYGVIIYQEQVQKIAQVMGGYTLGGADLLRRAMGKKIKEEMDSHRGIFTEGAIKNEVKKEQASHIFDLVAKFAGYGFNKSHAAAYALVSYQTAYMKANYPVEFIAASMNYDLNNTDKLSVFKQEAKYLGIEMLTPDVNRSQALFSVEKLENGKRAVRYGLAALKNVGETAMQALVDERERGGKFKDLFDFAGRLDTKIINKRALENLIKAGALDALNPNRQQMLESVEVLLQYSNAMAREKESNQVSLFGGADAQAMPTPALKECRDWPQLERLQNEFSAVGFYLSSHPLEGYAKNLKRMGIVSSGLFESKLAENYNPVRVAGIVLGIKSKVSPRGKFSFIQLSDVDGIYEVSVFDETLLIGCRNLLEPGKLLLINADGKRDDGGVRLIAQGMSMLDEAVVKNQQGELHVYIDKDSGLAELKSMIEPARSKMRNQGMQVKLLVAYEGEERVVVSLPESYLLSPGMVAIMETLPGVSQVVEA